jgi:hypothetical protein
VLSSLLEGRFGFCCSRPLKIDATAFLRRIRKRLVTLTIAADGDLADGAVGAWDVENTSTYN